MSQGHFVRMLSRRGTARAPSRESPPRGPSGFAWFTHHSVMINRPSWRSPPGGARPCNRLCCRAPPHLAIHRVGLLEGVLRTRTRARNGRFCSHLPDLTDGGLLSQKVVRLTLGSTSRPPGNNSARLDSRRGLLCPGRLALVLNFSLLRSDSQCPIIRRQAVCLPARPLRTLGSNTVNIVISFIIFPD